MSCGPWDHDRSPILVPCPVFLLSGMNFSPSCLCKLGPQESLLLSFFLILAHNGCNTRSHWFSFLSMFLKPSTSLSMATTAIQAPRLFLRSCLTCNRCNRSDIHLWDLQCFLIGLRVAIKATSIDNKALRGLVPVSAVSPGNILLAPCASASWPAAGHTGAYARHFLGLGVSSLLPFIH